MTEFILDFIRIKQYYDSESDKQQMLLNCKNVLIDNGIVNIVKILKNKNFPTIASCSGIMQDHLYSRERMLLHPYIAFNKLKMTEKQIQFLKDIAEKNKYYIRDFSDKKDCTLFSINLHNSETDRNIYETPILIFNQSDLIYHYNIDRKIIIELEKLYQQLQEFN